MPHNSAVEHDALWPDAAEKLCAHRSAAFMPLQRYLLKRAKEAFTLSY